MHTLGDEEGAAGSDATRGQEGPQQVKSSPVKSGQVKSSQVKSGQEGPQQGASLPHAPRDAQAQTGPADRTLVLCVPETGVWRFSWVAPSEEHTATSSNMLARTDKEGVLRGARINIGRLELLDGASWDPDGGGGRVFIHPVESSSIFSKCSQHVFLVH